MVAFNTDFLPIPYMAIIDNNLTPGSRIVLGLIYYITQKRGEKCFMSNNFFARSLNMTAKSVQNSLLLLENNGYIQREFADEGKKKRIEIKCLVQLKKVAKNQGYEDSMTQVRKSDDTGVRKSDDHNKINNNKINNKTQEIFDFWNEKNIVNHQKLTEPIKSACKTLLREMEVEEIKHAITVYAEIYHSPDTFWTHRWTLSEFLRRKNGAREFQHKTIGDYSKIKNGSYAVV